MPGRSIRKQLIEQTRQAIDHLDRLDYIIADMKIRSKDRQPAIDEFGPILVEGHEQLRSLWHALRARL
jgi:hypothetical protein